jgi:hypothetical protein
MPRHDAIVVGADPGGIAALDLGIPVPEALPVGPARKWHCERHGHGYPGDMSAETHHPELRSPEAGAVPAGKPTLDGIEDKWMQRWAKERVVQV